MGGGVSDWDGNAADSQQAAAQGGQLASSETPAAGSAASPSHGRPVGKAKSGLTSDTFLTPVKQQELRVQQQYLHELHREFNTRKRQLEDNAAQLSSLESQLKEVQEKIVNGKAFESIEAATRGVTSEEQARDLERLQETCDRHLQYNRVMQFMVTRLDRNKLVCDARVEAQKRGIYQSQKELQSLLIKLREAQNSERLGRDDLVSAKARTEAEEAEWKERLEARREVMRETNEIFEFREQQMAQKTAIIAEVKGDLDADGEQNLQRKVVTNRMKQLRLAEKIDQYEQAFKRIVEATGINSMEQVVEKFLSQNDTSANLKAMIEEANAKIAELSDARNKNRKEAEQIRFAGIGHTNKQRKVIDDKEMEIDTVAKTNKKLAERTEFLQGVIRGIKDGIEHISYQLDNSNVPAVAAQSHDVAEEIPGVARSTSTANLVAETTTDNAAASATTGGGDGADTTTGPSGVGADKSDQDGSPETPDTRGAPPNLTEAEWFI
ncbi:Outer dynein arm protein 1 (Docking complex component 2), partial [Durusdinium trenchii]